MSDPTLRDTRPHLVFVAARVPIPWVNGICFQEFDILRLLARTHAIHLIAMDNADLATPEAVQAVETLRALCVEVTIFPRIRGKKVASARRRAVGILRGVPSAMAHNVRTDCREHLRDLVARFPDIAIFVSSYFIVDILTGLDYAGRAIVYLHNIESTFLREAARAEQRRSKSALLRVDALVTARSERVVFGRLHAHDTILACTPDDAAQIARQFRHTARVDTMPLCPPYDADRVPADAGPAAEPVAVFTGILDNPLNIGPIQWFVERVWPQVRAAVPEAHLLIAGRRPTPEVLALGATPGVSVIANPRDMGAVLRRAAVCIAPIFHGAGVKQKCLEAFLWRVPLVTTRKGAEGLTAQAGEDYILADGPEEFARAVVSLLRDPALRMRMATNGRHYVEAAHGDTARLAALARAGLAVATSDAVRIV